ncbi:MAG: hypothetical protein QM753_00035 [Thermomicrobiales bacterium]
MRTSRRTLVLSTLVGSALTGERSLASAFGRQRSLGPEETAVLLAQYEKGQDLTSLLTYLHKDAAAIIPREAIAGWYRDVWFPTGPGPITVQGMTTYDWTWGVNGVTYPGTAEVSFVQSFADGSVANDVVRLVEYDGVWHWFFGRDIDFVNAQIAAYAPGKPLVTADSARAGASGSAAVPASGDTAPYGVAVLAGLSEDDFLALAPDMAGSIARSPRSPETASQASDGRGAHRIINYFNDPDGELYPVGVVGTFTLARENDELAYLQDRATPVKSPWGGMLTPEIEQIGVDGEVHYQMQTEFASEAVGNATNLYFTVPGSGIIYVIGAVVPANLAALAKAMVAKAGRRGA